LLIFLLSSLPEDVLDELMEDVDKMMDKNSIIGTKALENEFHEGNAAQGLISAEVESDYDPNDDIVFSEEREGT
jgi:hypothetical protein